MYFSYLLLLFIEKPDTIVIQRVGDTSSLGGHHEVVASAGEDLELECITTGGNPPAKMKWYMGDQEIHTGHTQEDSRPSLLNEENNIISQSKARTWTSISRLMLPVSKSDNGATVRCVAQHPALDKPLEQKTFLTIHCKFSNFDALIMNSMSYTTFYFFNNSFYFIFL